MDRSLHLPMGRESAGLGKTKAVKSLLLRLDSQGCVNHSSIIVVLPSVEAKTSVVRKIYELLKSSNEPLLMTLIRRKAND